jgi:hypothetical protein
VTQGQTYEALVAILSPQALRAEDEQELEDRGLIVTDHRPYAHLTAKGLAFVERVRAERAAVAKEQKTYRVLKTAEEVDEFISDEDLGSALDWFDGEPKMPTDEFLDRLFPKYGGLYDSDGAELDLDSLDNPAARRIMARARKLRKERDS